MSILSKYDFENVGFLAFRVGRMFNGIQSLMCFDYVCQIHGVAKANIV